MRFKELVKQNILLIAGIAIPVFVVVIFAVVALIPMMGEKPQFDCLFSTGYAYSSPYTFKVKKGKLYISYYLRDRRYNSPTPRLYRYIAATQNIIEIPLDIEDFEDDQVKSRSKIVEEVADLNLDPSKISPDGFQLGKPSRSRGSTFPLLFSSRSHYDSYIWKKGSRVKLPLDENAYNTHFLAWVNK